jgi:hypothetical protein
VTFTLPKNNSVNGEELLYLERKKERSERTARPCSVQRDLGYGNGPAVTAGVSL